jgi:hypothetical protein
MPAGSTRAMDSAVIHSSPATSAMLMIPATRTDSPMLQAATAQRRWRR